MFTWSALASAVLVIFWGQSGSNLPTQVPNSYAPNATAPARNPRVDPSVRQAGLSGETNGDAAGQRGGMGLRAPLPPAGAGGFDGAANPGDAIDPTTAEQPAPRDGAIRISPRSRPGRFFDRNEPDEQEQEAKPSASTRQMAWWVTTAIGLAIVLVVIALAGRAFRNMVPGLSETPSGPVHVLYRTFLTPKQSCCLLRVGDRLLLVGISGDNMQTLAEINDPREIDFIRGQCMQVRPRSTTQAFREILGGSKRMWQETLEPNKEPEEQAPGPAASGRSASAGAANFGTNQGGLGGAPDAGGRPATAFSDQMDQVRSQIEAWKARAKS